MPDDYCVVLTTCATREEAERIAESLVTRRLAACVQISDVSSFYLWKGELRKDHEHLLIMKSTAERYAKLEAALREIHSYEVPEIVMLPISKGFEQYLSWITAGTS